MKKLSTIGCSSLLFLLTACPRGESITLNNLLENEKKVFLSTNRNDLNQESSEKVENIVRSLERLERTEDLKSAGLEFKSIASDLDILAPHTGFTNRAPLTELKNEFLSFNENLANKNKSTLNLLSARTYSWLTSELVSTKFGL